MALTPCHNHVLMQYRFLVLQVQLTNIFWELWVLVIADLYFLPAICLLCSFYMMEISQHCEDHVEKPYQL